MAQIYNSKDNVTNCYSVGVCVRPFTTSDNPYAFISGGTRVYVRAFTGGTEQEAIDNKSSAGGSWITTSANEEYFRSLRFYCYPGLSLSSENSLVFARFEAYWPGLSQKSLKFSKIPVLCTYGSFFSSDNQGYYPSGSQVDGEGIVTIWLNGEQKNQYLTYGTAHSSIMNLRTSFSGYLPYYLASGVPVTENREMTTEAQTTGTGFYYHFLTGTSRPQPKHAVFTALTTDNKYKTVPEVAWNIFVACTEDKMPTYYECGAYEEDCDEDLNCGFENCAECGTYSCQMQLDNYCACYSTDLNYECKEDLSFYDSCDYIPLNCITCPDANKRFIPITRLNSLYDENNKSLLYANKISYRIEGKTKDVGNAGNRRSLRDWIAFSQTVANPVQDLENNGGIRYLALAQSALTSGYFNMRYFGISATLNFNGHVSANTDFDLTVGDDFVYDNIGQRTLVSGNTYSNTATVNSFLINLYVLRLKRLRVYYDENMFLDIRPVTANCTKGNLTLPQKTGLYDSVHSMFFPLTFSSSALTRCAPLGYNEGDVVPVDCLSSVTKYYEYFVHIDNAVQGIPVSTMKLRFEGLFIPTTIGLYNFVRHFATFSTSGTGVTASECVTRFDTSGSTGNTDSPRFQLSYSGNATSDSITGVNTQRLYGHNVDLTFGNRYVYAGSNCVYSASTQNCTASQRRLMIGLGYNRVFRRLRIYDGDTLVRDYRPGAMVHNSMFVPALREVIGGTAIMLDSSKVTTCPIPIIPADETFVLKCISEGNIHYQKSYQSGDTIDKTLITEPTSVGKTFVQWLPAIPDVMPDHDVTVNAQYAVNQYTIYYYVDGALYTQQSYLYGAIISQPTPPTPPTGYVFSGWEIPYNTMPAFDVNVYGTMDVYVPKYTINFYSGSTTWGSTPSCNKFSSSEYAQGATISYPTVSGTCYPLAYGGWKLSCTGGTNAPATMPANTLNVYCVTGYKVSTIHWMAKATGSTYTEYGTQNAEYLDSITEGPDLSSNAPSGYEWRGWGNLVPFSMPCEDKYVYGTFYKESAVYYTYTLYADGQVFLQRQYEAGETIPYSGSDSVIGNLPSSVGSCSITWSQPQPYITEMPSSNISATTVSTKATHTLSYYVDNALYNQENAQCGSSLTAIALPNEPGYSYSSWSPSVPSTMPDNDVSVYSQSTRILYHVYYYKNSSLWATDDYYYGDTITPHELPTDIGKTYSDWNPSLPSTMPANNISTYSSSAGTQYQIYYYLYNTSGATSSTLYTTRTFTYQQAVSSLANANPPTGQFFSGWTGEPSTMPANDVYVSGWTIPSPYQLIWSYDGLLY